MTPKQLRVTAKEILLALERKGFMRVRSSGSHIILRNAAGVRVTVPYHAGKILHPKLLSTILRDTGLTAEELFSR